MPALAPRAVLITGASGFIGRHLVAGLARGGVRVVAASRQPLSDVPAGVEWCELPDLANAGANNADRFRKLVSGCDAVIHLAGLAHAGHVRPDEDYRAINVDATRTLAVAAREAGVRRFILMSSVRAQAGPSAVGVIDEICKAEPTDAYGRSKLAAEQVVAATLDGTATDWVALRPVLVYGPGVGGNMASLIRLARLPLPLPLAGLSSRRSILAIANLTGAVAHALQPATPAGRCYLVADRGAIAIGDMIAAMRSGLGRKPGLVALPPSVLSALLMGLGHGADVARLLGSLEVDTARLRATGWMPSQTSLDGLAQLMRHPAKKR